MKHVYTILFLLLISFFSRGQDFHFSQFFSSPQFVNPALIGLYGADFRAIVHLKQQNGIKGQTKRFKTVAAMVDGTLMRKKSDMGYFGLGVNFFNDQAGRSNLNVTRADVIGSYHYRYNDRTYISAGIETSFLQRSADATNITWGNQFDGNSFDATLPTGEDNINSTANFYDLAVGFQYTSKINRNFSISTGLAGFHINAPRQGFTTTEYNLNPKYIFNSRMEYNINKEIHILPTFYYIKQASIHQMNVGIGGKYFFTEANVLFAEVNFRNLNTLTFETRVYIQDYSIGISYDVSITNTTAANMALNSPEISFIYQGNLSSPKRHQDIFHMDYWPMPDDKRKLNRYERRTRKRKIHLPKY